MPRRKAIKTHWCEHCVHNRSDPSWRRGSFSCARGHRPRFFAPKSDGDQVWGYKRKCADYEEADNG